MKNTAWTLTLTTLGWVMALMFYIAYTTKPVEIIKQVNGNQENYNLKKIETAGKLCNGQGGVLTSYDINDYGDEVSISMRCEFSKETQ